LRVPVTRSALSSLWVLAAAHVCSCLNPHERIGDYQPVSNVVEMSQFAFDIKGITNAAHEHDFITAKAIYEGGRYSCASSSAPRNLKSFVTWATATSSLRGTAYFDSFTGGAGPAPALGEIPGPGRLHLPLGFWDDFISSALDGSGGFWNKTETSRMVAVKKGILGVVTMYVSHLLEEAIMKASQGETDDATGAPHAWDQAWALYYGACGEQCRQHCVTSGWCRFSAWEATKKRDVDHAYDSSHQRVPGTVVASVAVTDYFLSGQRASRRASANMTALIEARDNIYRIFAVTAIRASLRYAYAMNRGAPLKYKSLNELVHMQAYAYFLTAAGWIEQASSGTGQRVLALLDYRSETGKVPISLYCDVKAALTSAYEALGLDCAKIGQDKAIPATMQCEVVPACPVEVTLPKGAPDYVPDDVNTTAGANIDCGHALMTSTAAPTLVESFQPLGGGADGGRRLLVVV